MSSHPNIIDKAIDEIREQGWIQVGRSGTVPGSSPGGRVCIGNALYHAANYDIRVQMPAVEAVNAELGNGPVFNLGSVYRFNDDPNTTLEDVLLVMKKASARLDEQTS